MSEAFELSSEYRGHEPPDDGYEWHDVTMSVSAQGAPAPVGANTDDLVPRWVRGKPKVEKSRRCQVEIEIKPNGTGSVLIDGHDLSNRISKIEFVAQAGKPSEVVLYMRAVEVKVMASAFVTHKLLTLDPDTAQEVSD